MESSSIRGKIWQVEVLLRLLLPMLIIQMSKPEDMWVVYRFWICSQPRSCMIMSEGVAPSILNQPQPQPQHQRQRQQVKAQKMWAEGSMGLGQQQVVMTRQEVKVVLVVVAEKSTKATDIEKANSKRTTSMVRLLRSPMSMHRQERILRELWRRAKCSTIQARPTGTMRRSRLRGCVRKRKSLRVPTHMATICRDSSIDSRISRQMAHFSRTVRGLENSSLLMSWARGSWVSIKTNFCW